MFRKWFRWLLGVALGGVAAFVLVVAVELFSAVVHPFPSDFSGSEEAMCEHVANYPAWVLAVIVPMWSAVAWSATWVAGRIGGLVAAVTIGVLLLAALALNLSMLPYPMWFKLVQPLMVMVAIGLVWRRTMAGSRG
jgi:hypothetical protein